VGIPSGTGHLGQLVPSGGLAAELPEAKSRFSTALGLELGGRAFHSLPQLLISPESLTLRRQQAMTLANSGVGALFRVDSLQLLHSRNTCIKHLLHARQYRQVLSLSPSPEYTGQREAVNFSTQAFAQLSQDLCGELSQGGEHVMVKPVPW